MLVRTDSKFMPGDTYDRTCMCPHTCMRPHTCNFPRASEKSPVPSSLKRCNRTCQTRTSLSQLQHWLLPPFAVITLHYSVSSQIRHLKCLSNKKLYVFYAQILSYVQFQIIPAIPAITLAIKGACANSSSCTNFSRHGLPNI